MNTEERPTKLCTLHRQVYYSDGSCPWCDLEYGPGFRKERAKESDPVNHPAHYQLFPGQEAIDVIKAALTPEEFAGYCKGNALKYRLRAGEKGDTQQDIDKSNWYRDRLRQCSKTT